MHVSLFFASPNPGNLKLLQIILSPDPGVIKRTDAVVNVYTLSRLLIDIINSENLKTNKKNRFVLFVSIKVVIYSDL